MQTDHIPDFTVLKETLQADGADLELDSVENGVASVRLILGPEACLECIMPKETIEQILLTSLSRSEPVTSVRLDDPRERP